MELSVESDVRDVTAVGRGIATFLDEDGTECFAAGLEVEPRESDYVPVIPFLRLPRDDAGPVVRRVLAANGIDPDVLDATCNGFKATLVDADAPDGRLLRLVVVDGTGLPPDVLSYVVSYCRDVVAHAESDLDCWVRVLSADEVADVVSEYWSIWG